MLIKRVKDFYLNEYENNISELKKKYHSNKIKRTYNYEQNLIIEEDKTYSLEKFVNGDYLEYLNK